MQQPKLAERAVQRANIRLLAMMGCYAVHIPNGSHLAGDKIARAKQMAALKADGLAGGFPDLIVMDLRSPDRGNMPARQGFIEVKREGLNKLEPDQEVWRDELMRLGIPWAMVNTADGGAAVLRAWGWR